MLVGLLSILILLWIVFYAVPGVFASLFNTLLGNLILLLGIILVGTKNAYLAIGLLAGTVILYKFSHYVANKE